MQATWMSAAAVALVLGQWAAQLWLASLNRRHVLAHAAEVPEAFAQIVDRRTYDRSIQYTLAKIGLHRFEVSWGAIVLLAALASGILPAARWAVRGTLGASVWIDAGFLLLVGGAFALSRLPLDWYGQFRLEQRFGFNTTSPGTWWADRLKAAALVTGIGLPVIAIVLHLATVAGSGWWLWAWVAVLALEILLMVVAPALILPIFNKLTPLADGDLRDRLVGLARRTGFQARSIQVMDGSRRSLHGNAFFTGLGRLRRIVLFDTLLGQLDAREIEAVLAHEIGHHKRRHVPKLLAGSAAGSLAGFYVLGRLAREDAFVRAFGFTPGDLTATLLVFALLAGTVTFWLSPLASFWSRRYEYDADRYALEVVGDRDALVGALRKLSEKNLANLTPHPIYSRFYYSHPTLLEREAALGR